MALVAFLRGINVGGHRAFRPAALARELALLDVANIGAAGTFVVGGPVTAARLRAELVRRLPFDAEIAICRGAEVESLVARSPFAKEPARPGLIRFVSVLTRRPRSPRAVPARIPSTGEWFVRILGQDGSFVFGVHRRHMRAIGHLRAIERLYGVPVTTRSWETIRAVAGEIAVRRGLSRKKPRN